MPKWQLRGAKSKQSPGVSKTVPPVVEGGRYQTWATFMDNKNDQNGQ